ncbi:MAG TPA: hypothetical protein VH308_05150 [Terracidiphilus sp.]|nr:hypothetical protein [Terracidiphilus sp.]
MRSLPIAVAVSVAMFGHASSSFAQNIPSPQGVSICDDPNQPHNAIYNKYCVSNTPSAGNHAGSRYGDNGDAQRAADAAAAQRKRHAELEQQRIEAENRRRREEAEKQAKFDHDKREALGELKGIAGGGDFDSTRSLKGVGATDSGLKGAPNSRDSTGLKTLPDVNTDPRVVDARDVPTGLPRSVAAEIPDTPAGNRVRKGLQAIQSHDWIVALAWFRDAHNYEPGNAGIQRLIELAQYTMARASRPHPSTPPAKPAADTGAQDRATLAAVDRRMDSQMESGLAMALDDFNRNYLPKHPDLLMPVKAPGVAQATIPTSAGTITAQPTADQEARWKLFFSSIFTRPRRVLIPTSVAGVRD